MACCIEASAGGNLPRSNPLGKTSNFPKIPLRSHLLPRGSGSAGARGLPKVVSCSRARRAPSFSCPTGSRISSWPLTEPGGSLQPLSQASSGPQCSQYGYSGLSCSQCRVPPPSPPADTSGCCHSPASSEKLLQSSSCTQLGVFLLSRGNLPSFPPSPGEEPSPGSLLPQG